MASQGFGPTDGGRGDDRQGDFVDFLGLPDCETLRRDDIEHIVLVHAMYKPQIPERCPECHGIWEPQPQGKFLAPFADIPRGSNPVVVVLLVLQNRCMDCGRSLEVYIPWLHASRQMTFRLENYILERVATLSTFDQIALDTCQDWNTVESIFMDAFRTFDIERGKNLPRVLGIDEVFIHRKYYTILVDGETGHAVDLLPGLRHEIIKPRLEQASNREAVEYVLQDFSLTFRSAATQPPALNRMKNRKKSSPSSDLTPLLFPEPPEYDAEDPLEEERALRLSRDALATLLPNSNVVGDHFHFKKAIEDGFDKIRIDVQKHVKHEWPKQLVKELLKHYTTEEIILQGKENIVAKAEAEAAKLAEDREDDLVKHRHTLFKHPQKLTGDEWSWLKKTLPDHPLLRRGWEAKNSGLSIFPEKRPLGRSRKSRGVAKAERAALLITNQEAGRRLDEWVASIAEELQPFFGKPLRLIKNWREEIIRIGTTGYSNADAESKNRHLRMLMAISRGLGFEILRARLLWADAHRRTDRWPSFCYDDEQDKIDTKRFVELAKAHIARKNSAPQTADEASKTSLTEGGASPVAAKET